MARRDDPRAFRDFLDAAISTREPDLTLEDALRLWEDENRVDLDRDATHRAIREGLADADAGRLRPIDEFLGEFRRKHGLEART